MIDPRSGFKETKCFFPLSREDSIFWGASVTDRYGALPQTARVRISNPVSGGKCHLILLTILMRFSWPSLDYIVFTFIYRTFSRIFRRLSIKSARKHNPVLGQCWSTACNTGPTLTQHWVYIYSVC